MLDAIGLSGFFERIASLEMGENKIESLRSLLRNVAPVKACLVGDRRFDMEAAQANHIPFIGCGYGYAPDEIAHADYVVWKPEDIVTAVYLIYLEICEN